MMKILAISFLFLIPVFRVAAQADLEALKIQEDSLCQVLDNLRKAPKDAQRKEWNTKFKSLLRETLDMRGVFDYPFDSLKTIATIKSPDNYFRLFNWNIENDNGTYNYYAFVLVPDNKIRVFELNDMSQTISEPENKTLDNKKWFGALYYQIIVSGNSGRKEYTLLGWDGNNKQSACKIIDVMTIYSDKIQFGLPIFTNENKGISKRVVFEFSSQARMTLNWDEKNKMIVFDHLIPETPAAEGIREFYFPDGSYDAFKLENGKWVFVSDVDARRTKDKRDKFFNQPNDRQ
jgi:hypothetical protein